MQKVNVDKNFTTMITTQNLKVPIYESLSPFSLGEFGKQANIVYVKETDLYYGNNGTTWVSFGTGSPLNLQDLYNNSSLPPPAHIQLNINSPSLLIREAFSATPEIPFSIRRVAPDGPLFSVGGSTGQGKISIGNNATSNNSSSITIGDTSTSGSNTSIIIGNGLTNTDENSFVFGSAFTSPSYLLHGSRNGTNTRGVVDGRKGLSEISTIDVPNLRLEPGITAVYTTVTSQLILSPPVTFWPSAGQTFGLVNITDTWSCYIINRSVNLLQIDPQGMVYLGPLGGIPPNQMLLLKCFFDTPIVVYGYLLTP